MKEFLDKKAGFTIIELLVVIVVIAILAAITITAYQNVQVRAKNSQTIQAVSQYRKALLLYEAEHGKYPINYTSCIGSGYPDLNGDSEGDCRYGNISGDGYTINSDSSFEQEMKGYLNSSTPRPAARIETPGDNIMVGAYFQGGDDPDDSLTLDGQPVLNWIVYVIEGYHAKCPIGPVYQSDGEWWQFVSPATDYSFSEGDGVQCWLPLPNVGGS